MRKMKEIRTKKGFSFRSLSKETGVPYSTISDFEKGKIKNLNEENLKKIANVLGCSTEDLKAEIVENNKKNNKCLNERCLLNKNKKCVNDVVLSGRAPCYGKDKVQSKGKAVNLNDTRVLFAK